MGLLDEAIRDHLELKRLQGADPEEIARKEREALEPVLPDEPATWGGEPSPALDGVSEQEGAESGGPVLEDAGHDAAVEGHSAPSEAQGADFSTVGQETVEIDMREVLGDDGDAFIDAYSVERAGPVRAGRITGVNAVARDDEFEWEVAGRVGGGEPAQSIPGQERLSFE